MNLGLQTPVRDILRHRPLSVMVLDIASGEGFWHYLDNPLGDFCQARDLDPAALLYQLANLPATLPEKDWAQAPLYELIDRLAEDHRHFREKDLPHLERQLAQTEPAEFPPEVSLEDLRAAFHSFKIDFLLHMNEEEDYLFPKALRTEASVEHPALSAETFTGTVAAYPSNMLHMPEHQVKALAVDLLRKSAGSGEEPSPALERFRAGLEEFATRLVRHADLEAEVLMPRTLALEKRLNDRLAEDRQREQDF